jgi:hypothetical protein
MSPLALSRFWPAEALKSQSLPAEDGEARAGGRRGAPSLPTKEKPRPCDARAGLMKNKPKLN